MSDDTLSTDRVRMFYTCATAWRTDDDPNRPDLTQLRNRQEAEFDAWHAAEVRKAKAAALRDMGREFETASEQGTGVRDMIAAQFCYDRANQIEGNQ